MSEQTLPHTKPFKFSWDKTLNLKGILGYEERHLVSIDYKDDPRSAIIDAPSTMVIDQTQVKVLAWYDNEFGSANRLAELILKVAKSF